MGRVPVSAQYNYIKELYDKYFRLYSRKYFFICYLYLFCIDKHYGKNCIFIIFAYFLILLYFNVLKFKPADFRGWTTANEPVELVNIYSFFSCNYSYLLNMVFRETKNHVRHKAL